MPKHSTVDSPNYQYWAGYHDKDRQIYRRAPDWGRRHYVNYIKPIWYPHYQRYAKQHEDYFNSEHPYKTLKQWRRWKNFIKSEVADSYNYDWGHRYTPAEIAREKRAAQDACWDCEDPYEPPRRPTVSLRPRYTFADLGRLKRLAADSQWDDADPYDRSDPRTGS